MNDVALPDADQNKMADPSAAPLFTRLGRRSDADATRAVRRGTLAYWFSCCYRARHTLRVSVTVRRHLRFDSIRSRYSNLPTSHFNSFIFSCTDEESRHCCGAGNHSSRTKAWIPRKLRWQRCRLLSGNARNVVLDAREYFTDRQRDWFTKLFANANSWTISRPGNHNLKTAFRRSIRLLFFSHTDKKKGNSKLYNRFNHKELKKNNLLLHTIWLFRDWLKTVWNLFWIVQKSIVQYYWSPRDYLMLSINSGMLLWVNFHLNILF